MERLGAWLRQAREAKGVTLKEAEATSRIRARFLELLEAGDFAAFPGGEVQIRGFLRIYARYLDLSPDETLARYEAETRPAEAVPPSVPPQEAPSASPVRSDTAAIAPELRPAATQAAQPRRLNTETVMIAGIVLIVLLMAITAVGYTISRNIGKETAPTATAPAQATLPTRVTTATSPLVTPTFPANPEGGVTLALEATEHVWARVTVDGAVAFEGMLAPGGTPSWSGQEIIAVDTGNGAGLRVTVNGQSQGAMCGRSQVCTRAWAPSGETAPAPMAAP
jgi:transcriptional regulator with XRE-family HTH domain